MSMPRTYVAHDDMTVALRNELGYPVVRKRVQGPPVLMDHSESDLRAHRAAGVVAVVVSALMVIAIVAVLVW